MTRIATYVSAAALGFVALALAGSPAAEAGHHHHKHKKDKDDTDVCTYSAHGSDAEHGNDAKGGPSGSGGGKPANDCSKVFARWGDGSVSVYVSNAGAPTGFSTALSTYTANCFDTWACSSGLTFTVSTNSADAATADITVSWGDLGSTGVLGQTSTSYSGGLISSSDVVMNSNVASFNWTLGPSQNVDGSGCFTETANGNTSSSNYDLLSVLLHEIGHSVGISHPTSRCSSRDHCYPETMNPCTDAEEYMRRTLGDGDIKSIQTNYGL